MAKENKVMSFHDQLFHALNLLHHPAELGAQSVLAAPYFLGDYLLSQPAALQDQEVGRGNALRALLSAAASDLPTQHKRGDEYEQLLRLSFFQRRQQLDGDVWDELGMARATYFRQRTAALEALESAVIRRVNPALRSERPQQPRFFTGREETISTCRAALMKAQSTGLAGPAGIGKTSLAAYVLAQLEARPVFWFTFHLGLNDQLSTLLFSLAHFLHGQGASGLWLQLVADRGQIDLAVLPGLLRNELTALQSEQPLFCLDDVDLLRPEIEAHEQILNFIQSFPKGYSLLLIGQTIPLVTDAFVWLDGLPTDAIGKILQNSGIALDSDQLHQLQGYITGNPRLLNLYMALHASGESLAVALAKLTAAPSLEALLNRVWLRLTDLERTILLQMSVYRRPVPADVWSEPSARATLARLGERQLVQGDRLGGVALLPAYRQILYDSTPMEVRESLHLEAAAVRTLRGEFTAAAYHFAKAGRPGQALQTWYPHRYTEIDQGQASAALHVFEEISRNQLPERIDQELLSLIRGELQKLLGNYQQAQETLQAITWRTPRLSALARRLIGDIAELSGELETARIVYAEGLSLIGNMLETELVLFHRDLGWIQRRRKSLEEAWDEAQRAQCEVEYLKGHICRDRGQFAQATQHYLQALQLAQDLKMVDSEAKTRNVLAAVLIKQGRFAEAEAHFQQAYQAFQRLGKVLSVASVSVNQAVACLLDERLSDAIAYAEKARTIFEQIQHPYGIATAYQALAEAYLANGDLDDATVYAWKAVETEESAIIPDALRVIGEIYRERGAFDQAMHYLSQSLEMARENEDKYLEAYTLRALAKLNLQQANDRDSEAYLQRAMEIFDEIGLSYEAERSRQLLPQTVTDLP